MEAYLEQLEEHLKHQMECPTNLYSFFVKEGKKLVEICRLINKQTVSYFQGDTQRLIDDNHKLFQPLVTGYEKSYTNPTYAVEVFGLELGRIVAYVSYSNIKAISYAYKKNKNILEKWVGTFIELFEQLRCDQENLEIIREIIQDFQIEADTLYYHDIVHVMSGFEGFYEKILKESGSDKNYLFRYGHYISQQEIEIAKYIDQLDQQTIEIMSRNFVLEGYKKGFINDKKDYAKKQIVEIRYPIGFERVVRRSMELLKQEMNLTKITVGGLYSTDISQQMTIDHQYDKALYYDSYYADNLIKRLGELTENHKDGLRAYSGVAVIERFGMAQFYPQSKIEACSLSQEQTEIYANFRSLSTKKFNTYAPRSEWSFVIVAYPVPEIGPQFEAIFNDTILVNTLDSKVYEAIQKSMIDQLDKGQYVRVTGRNGNKTDITVALESITDSHTQTLFENCTTGVNIPAGECFTTPKLKGTNGKIHVKEVFLDGLKYIDLELDFIDGRVVNYMSGNFADLEENKKYVFENLMFPHHSLPIGEFAIGTNTIAYALAHKYQIHAYLPILIAEKMGPHFAIGDTCFMHSEDNRVFNPDGKEIIAKENEISCKRKESFKDAYLNIHTDITIPYSELDKITVITSTGEEIAIIANGLFVLPGTELLNEPLIDLGV